MTRPDVDVASLSNLGEVLRRTGVVTPEQLEEASMLAKYKSMPLGEALVSLGHITADKLDWALRMQRDLRGPTKKAQRALAELVDSSMASAAGALTKFAQG